MSWFRSRSLRRTVLSLAVATLLSPALALAADVPAGADASTNATPPASDSRHADGRKQDRHVKDMDAVVVTASPLRDAAGDLSQPVEVLAGERLDENRGASVGETVASLPVVQSSNFGPGVGRPIIRGLDGPRVAVLSNGLST